MKKTWYVPWRQKKILQSFVITKMRFVYQNEDIIVTHPFTKFYNGTSDAIIMVYIKKMISDAYWVD